MAILEAHSISKSFPGVKALNNINISFERGEVHCIIGENGAGKSTLIKVFTGIYQNDSGKLLIDGGNVENNQSLFEKVSYVPQEIELFEDLSVGENLFMPLHREIIGKKVSSKNINHKAISILKKFNIKASPQELVKNISISDKQLLQIAQGITNTNSNIILFDEPTTSLTKYEVRRLFKVINELRTENKAIIFISHKIEEIIEIGQKVTVLRDGEITSSSSVENVDEKFIIKKMTGKSPSNLKNYKPDKIDTNDLLLKVNNLTGKKFSDVSFNLYKGEILGFSGLVGSGRTEIMQTIFGYLPIVSGNVTVNGTEWKMNNTNFSVKNGMVYIPEERKSQGLFLNLSVTENTIISLLKSIKSRLFLDKNKIKKATEEIIKNHNVKTSSSKKEIKFLSGGNQQKVIIGRSIHSSPNILIFDEPTKGIDVGAKEEIYSTMKNLAEKGIGIILISSELDEILRCSNRIITLYEGKIQNEFINEDLNPQDVIKSYIGS